MKLALFILALAVPSLAAAQSPETRFNAVTPIGVNPPMPFLNLPGRYGDTPTMRVQKLRWAITLREEVAELLRQDGGVLTSEHKAYVRRRSQRILYGT